MPDAPMQSPVDTAAEEVALENAIAALESQRALLGDAVTDTALGPLVARRAALRSGTEERRLVTVLFADLVDFTVLARRLDAEDVRAVVDAYFVRWRRVIADHGGVVEKFIGDAVMAVFGLRHSFEDDAHRAVRAALTMIADLDALNAEIEAAHGVRLSLRAGVDTGDVVVSTLGDRDGGEFVAVGETVNRAARLQAAAPVDGVLVSPDTRRHVRGSFAMQERPGLRLKGIDEPVDAWVVLGEHRRGFRMERARGVEGVETDTVGREAEAASLRDRLAEVEQDRTYRLVTVVGDAGVGKSRLLLDFDAWLAERPEAVWWFRGRASPVSAASPGALLRDVLSARLGIRLDDDREAVRTRFADGFDAALGSEAGPLAAAQVAAWLGFDPVPEVPADPQALRDRGAAALARYFAALAERVPVVLLLEDLHWADDETLRWLDTAAPMLRDAAVLVVATARPALLEARPAWGTGPGGALLDLAPLPRTRSRDLLGRLLAGLEEVPPELAEPLLDSSEGNPFYLEELVGWLLDTGVVVRGEPRWRVVPERMGAVAVPPTLRAVLQSRLDGLGTRERVLLQRASVIGRVFWDTALDSLDARGGASAPALDALGRRDVVREREVSRFSGAREFLFKHALLRDVAYDAVLRRQRQRYHRAAAGWLAAAGERAGRTEEVAAVVAQHLERAAVPEAAAWYLRAARRAASVHALTETAALLDGGERTAGESDVAVRFDLALEREALLERIGDREEQSRALDAATALEPRLDDARLVRLLLARSRWAFVHSDYAAAVDAATTAAARAEAAGRDDLLADALLQRGKAHTWADEPDTARGLLTGAEALAGRVGRADLLGESQRYLGIVAGDVGDYPASLEHLRRALSTFAGLGDAERESMALAQVSTTLFRLGRYAEAQSTLERTIPIFRTAGHRYREATSLGNLASIAVQRGRYADALARAGEAIAMQRELGEAEATAVSLLVLGTAELFTSRFAQAGARFEEALTIARSVGSGTLEVDALMRRSQLALVTGRPALDHARGAVAIAERAASGLDRGTAQSALGSVALAAGDTATAGVAFAAALAEFEALGLDGPARECRVGLAGVAVAEGRDGEALALLEPALEALTPAGLSGTALPGALLLTCLRVLESAGDPRRRQVQALARAYVAAMADEVGDAGLRAGYLAFPPHPELLAERASGRSGTEAQE